MSQNSFRSHTPHEEAWQHDSKHGFCGIRPLFNFMPASEISLQTEAGLAAMQDRQVHLQYLAEEHLGKFHDPLIEQAQ